MDEIDFTEPILPYAGTSGWSGSETSKERAISQDSNGTTLSCQKSAYNWVAQSGCFGKTWKELSLRTGWHHGTCSGVLSVLHKAGYIVRLKERRDGCAVYVIPDCIDNREVAKRLVKTCDNCGHEL